MTDLELDTANSLIPLEAKKPVNFSWNLFGWFASSFGATIWMMSTPLLLKLPSEGVYAAIIGTLLTWSVASIAWAFREKINAFRGFLLLLSTTVITNLSFILFAHVRSLPLDEVSRTIETSYRSYYGALLVLFLALVFYFWFNDEKSRKA